MFLIWGSMPMTILSNPVNLCEPGIKNRQPFSRVASSKATQMERARRSEKDQKGVSRCQAVGLAQGRLISAWSCQIRMPSAPDNFAAIWPIRWSSISSFITLFVCQRFSNWSKTFAKYPASSLIPSSSPVLMALPGILIPALSSTAMVTALRQWANSSGDRKFSITMNPSAWYCRICSSVN